MDMVNLFTFCMDMPILTNDECQSPYFYYQMDHCSIDCIQIFGNFTQEATCSFVQDKCLQDTIQFVQAYYCSINQSFILLVILAAIALALIYTALNAVTNHYLTPCVEEFIDRLNLSQGMAGVTFLAFANGAPDVITAVVAGASSSQSTALIPFGSLYGAALFDMALILAMVIQLSPTNMLTINKRQALLPLGFYIFGSLYLIAVSFFYGKMNAAISGIFLSLYPIFLICNIYFQRKMRQVKKVSILDDSMAIGNGEEDVEEMNVKEQIEEMERQLENMEASEQENDGNMGKVLHVVRLTFKYLFNYTIPPSTKEQWAPKRAIISLILAPFISMFSFGLIDSFEKSLLAIPFAAWFSFPSLLLLIHSLISIFRRSHPSSSTIFYSVYSFIVVVCWITMICSVLINLLELLQLLTNINPVFLGLTVLAWANCIGDYLSITAFAKKGYASTAIAGIFSGPLLTFLLGFGVSCTLNSLEGQYPFAIFDLTGDAYTQISDSIVVSVIVMAIAYMLWIFVRILRSRSGEVGKYEQKFAKFFYIGFLLVALFLSVLTDFYRTVQCDL